MSFTKLERLAFSINKLQSSDGTIKLDKIKAINLLHQVMIELHALSTSYDNLNDVSCMIDDIEEWLQNGLDQIPKFRRTATNLLIAEHPIRHLVFIGPYRTANSGAHRGFRFEFFHAIIEENNLIAKYKKIIPHPCDKTVPVRLKAGTPRLMEGNNIVFFPESITLGYTNKFQNFALFFFDKFRRIYYGTTLPIVNKTLGNQDIIPTGNQRPSSQMNVEEMYNARCLWGYLHDLFHFKGPRPFGKEINLKTRWSLGLLEEIKVDCQTAIYLHDHPTTEYAKEIFEFILFERLFRYPSEADAENNFDAGTGVFLFNYLNKGGVFTFFEGEYLIDNIKLLTKMRELTDEILLLEELLDEDYLTQGHSFVYRYLTPSMHSRFTINAEYINFVHGHAG